MVGGLVEGARGRWGWVVVTHQAHSKSATECSDRPTPPGQPSILVWTHSQIPRMEDTFTMTKGFVRLIEETMTIPPLDGPDEEKPPQMIGEVNKQLLETWQLIHRQCA